jgi:hypothetical protein
VGGQRHGHLRDDLAELIEELDLRDVILVGHSTGGGEVTRPICSRSSEPEQRASEARSSRQPPHGEFADIVRPRRPGCAFRADERSADDDS